MTFDATVNPVVYEGGVPVFIDTEYDTWNIVTHLRKESYFIVKKEYKNIMIRHNINHYLKIAQKSIDIKEKIAAIALYNNWLFFVKLWSVIV